MALVMGISAGYHESAAALLLDGEIVCAIAEERLSRIKHDAGLPVQAMTACLAQAKLPAQALDAVVFYEDPYEKLERVLVHALAVYPRALRQFPRAMAAQLGSRVWVLDALAHALGIARSKVSFCGHHEAHAASAFYGSPFGRAAVLVVDGVGESVCTSLWRGEQAELRCLGSQPFPHSLGLLYAALTAYLGFAVNDGEYKVMGLASFGVPRFAEQFEKLAHVDRQGVLHLTLSYFGALGDPELGFGPALERLLGPRRPPATPWRFSEEGLHESEQRWADVAASLQAFTESALLAFVRTARACTDAPALCIAGGVGLNAVANRRIARDGGFSQLFVQPAAGDAGGALGAAFLGALQAGDERPRPLAHCALGVPIDAGEASALASALGFSARRTSDPARAAASDIARGEIVGWATGACEWGPRALGQRSIVALPGSVATRDRLNRVVKRREPFRPFAPAVCASSAHRYFAPIGEELSAYMTSVTDVLDTARQQLSGVTHVDGTARLQTASADSAPGFHPLLEEVARETGHGVVLNTSLNGPSEPIVARAADALAFFAAHPLDALYVEDVCIRRRAT